MSRLVVLLIVFYQKTLSTMLLPRCRFYPTCSEYALQSIKNVGLVKGCWYAVCRLFRCHPFAKGGLDMPKRVCRARGREDSGLARLGSLMTANFTRCVKFLAATLDPAVKPRDDGVRNEAIKGLRLASLEMSPGSDDDVRNEAIKGPRLASLEMSPGSDDDVRNEAIKGPRLASLEMSPGSDNEVS